MIESDRRWFDLRAGPGRCIAAEDQPDFESEATRQERETDARVERVMQDLMGRKIGPDKLRRLAEVVRRVEIDQALQRAVRRSA